MAASTDVFRAQVENTRALVAARKQLARSINAALRHDRLTDTETRLYALLFSVWAEANFLKLIHTPYGFSNSEIIEIQKVWRRSGIASGWAKAIDLALRHVSGQRSGFVPNVRQRLQRFLKVYVIAPAEVRNKIAHGQWKVALNNDATAINHSVTAAMPQINVVQVDIWFEAHQMLAEMVENLVESPVRTFQNTFWGQVTKLDQFVERTRGWSVEAKVLMLKRKAAYKKT